MHTYPITVIINTKEKRMTSIDNPLNKEKGMPMTS